MIFVILNLNLKVSNMQGTELMFLCYTVYDIIFIWLCHVLVYKNTGKSSLLAIDILVFFTSNFI